MRKLNLHELLLFLSKIISDSGANEAASKKKLSKLSCYGIFTERDLNFREGF